MSNTSIAELSLAYIDGANLHRGTAELGWLVDYERFYVWLAEKFNIEKAYVFIGYVAKYERLYSKMKNAGFVLVFKEVIINKDGQIKGNCDSDLVLYAVRDYYEYLTTHTIFVSSDGDFASTVSFLWKDKDVNVTIVSPSKNCSILLMKTNVPLVYLNTQRNSVQLESKTRT